MKIIAKYSDYYDSIQGMGIDKSLIYNRDPRKISLAKEDDKYWSTLLCLYPKFGERLSDEVFSKGFILGFCGKLYPAMELIIKKNKRFEAEYISHYVYSYQDLKDVLVKYRLKKQLNCIERKKGFFSYSVDYQRTVKYFNPQINKDRVERIFFENKAPIFVFTGKRKEITVGMKKGIDSTLKIPEYAQEGLIINNNLKELGFFKLFDSYSAYQEIQMYLGGIIPKEAVKMVSISDHDMLYKKGFDNASFKKMPDNRKRKQKKGKISKQR